MDNSSSPRPTTASTTTLSQISIDTTSNHGWSFLQQTIDPNTSPRSLPPSTYIRSSTSQSSHSPVNHNSSHSQTLSRSLLNQFSTSTGHRSIATNPSLPSQPVLLRINSNNAYTHTSRMPRRSYCARPIRFDKDISLPVLEEFSIQGILSAIEEDIEGDLAVISEVLGRSRFVLADQYESQMAPLGEIRGVGTGIDAIEEEDLSRVRDDVMILREDASLVDGSNSGSAAYGLLERLQAVPRISGDGVERILGSENTPMTIHNIQHDVDRSTTLPPTVLIEPRDIAATRPHGPARPVVSEMYLSAEADGVSSGMVPIVSEAGRHFPLYTHGDTDLFSTVVLREPAVPVRRSGYVSGFDGIAGWFTRRSSGVEMDAEARLRNLLSRQAG